jgi:hypothetical protein
MKKFTLFFCAVAVLAAILVSGCGAAGPQTADPNYSVAAKGAFGVAPAVTIPSADAGPALAVRTLISGSGARIGASDYLAVKYREYLWRGATHRLVSDNFPNPVVSPVSRLLPGVKDALMGKRAGSRVLAVLPPEEGYGKAGMPMLGIRGSDTVVFVIDVILAVPESAKAGGGQVFRGDDDLPAVNASSAAAPAIRIPSAAPPSALTVRTLFTGAGPRIENGFYVLGGLFKTPSNGCTEIFIGRRRSTRLHVDRSNGQRLPRSLERSYQTTLSTPGEAVAVRAYFRTGRRANRRA